MKTDVIVLAVGAVVFIICLVAALAVARTWIAPQ
jgi:hypothetical protein